MKNFKKHIFISFSFLYLGLGGIVAQDKDRSLPQANKEYADNKFVDAEANYRISNSKFPNRTVAPYNLGNAIYKQNQTSEAKFAYAKAIKNTKSRAQKHKAFHNIGNVLMLEKDYTQAVEAYKNALRNDPSDEETRYNYALAKKKLKENPPKDNKDNKDKKDKDKKDKDKKDGEKDKDKKNGNGDDKDKDKKDGKNKDDKPEKKERPKPGGISKQRLENLLEAVSNEEKKVQDKVNAQKSKGKPTQTEKDW
jgi:tetratricopeptide (TPR) repeat protein